MKILGFILSPILVLTGSWAHAASCKTVDNQRWVTVYVSQDRAQITLIYGRSVAFVGEKIAASGGIETFNEMQTLDPVSRITYGRVPGVLIAKVNTANGTAYVDVEEDNSHVTKFVCASIP